MPKDYSRTERVADWLRRELAGLIQFELRDPRIGMIMVSDVEVSRDLAHAKVYVTVVGRESEAEAAESIEALNHAAGFLRSRIAKVSNMRTTPRLVFAYDNSVLRGEQLSALIDHAVGNASGDSGGKDDGDMSG